MTLDWPSIADLSLNDKDPGGMQDVAELVSLGLTVPTIALSVAVVVMFGQRLAKSFAMGHDKWAAVDWFVLGITLGFAGGVLDNSYWAVPWLCSFLDMPVTDSLANAGVYFNIVSRQGLGIASAYCHIKCATEYTEEFDSNISVNSLMLWSCGVGAIASCLLVIFRSCCQ